MARLKTSTKTHTVHCPTCLRPIAGNDELQMWRALECHGVLDHQGTFRTERMVDVSGHYMTRDGN